MAHTESSFSTCSGIIKKEPVKPYRLTGSFMPVQSVRFMQLFHLNQRVIDNAVQIHDRGRKLSNSHLGIHDVISVLVNRIVAGASESVVDLLNQFNTNTGIGLVSDDSTGIIQKILKGRNGLSILNDQNVLDGRALGNLMVVGTESVSFAIDVEVIARDDLIGSRIGDPVIRYEGTGTGTAIVGNHVGFTYVGASDWIPFTGLISLQVSVTCKDHHVNRNVLARRIQGINRQIQRHFATVTVEGISYAIGMNGFVIVSRVVVPVQILVLDQNGCVHILFAHRDLQLTREQGVHSTDRCCGKSGQLGWCFG